MRCQFICFGYPLKIKYAFSQTKGIQIQAIRGFLALFCSSFQRNLKILLIFVNQTYLGILYFQLQLIQNYQLLFLIQNNQMIFECQYHVKYNCVHVDLEDYEYFLFVIDNQPIIYMQQYRTSSIWKGLLSDVKSELRQQYTETLKLFFQNPKERHIETIQNYGDNIILQIDLKNQRKSLILPIVEVAKSQQLLIDMDNIRYMSQQSRIQEKFNPYEGSEKNQEIQEDLQNKQYEQSIIQKQFVEENGQIIQTNSMEEEEHQNGLRRICEFSQSSLRKKYKQQGQKYNILQKKYHLLEQEHRQLALQLKNAEQKLNLIAKGPKLPQQEQRDEGKQKYILHKYNDYQTLTIIKDNSQLSKQQTLVRDEQAQNSKSSNYDKYKNSYNNEFTDYYENNKIKKPTLNADGFNQFTFTHFSLGKYGNCFEVKDKNIIRFREADVFGSYYQMPSFDTIPLQGKTKVVFKLIKSKSNNIHVGILLTIRKRFRYSIHQENLISYKLKGGKYALHEDGDPAKIDCEQIKPGESLQMIVDRETNTIQFKKNISIRRQMPQRFKKADLFPFVTMKDIGDQVQIL